MLWVGQDFVLVGLVSKSSNCFYQVCPVSSFFLDGVWDLQLHGTPANGGATRRGKNRVPYSYFYPMRVAEGLFLSEDKRPPIGRPRVSGQRDLAWRPCADNHVPQTQSIVSKLFDAWILLGSSATHGRHRLCKTSTPLVAVGLSGSFLCACVRLRAA